MIMTMIMIMIIVIIIIYLYIYIYIYIYIYCPKLNTGLNNILTRTNLLIIEDVLMSDCLT